MYRRSSFILTIAPLFILGTAGTASAAQISQITWDVTGGSISAFGFPNPITGGTEQEVRLLPPREPRLRAGQEGVQGSDLEL